MYKSSYGNFAMAKLHNFFENTTISSPRGRQAVQTSMRMGRPRRKKPKSAQTSQILGRLHRGSPPGVPKNVPPAGKTPFFSTGVPQNAPPDRVKSDGVGMVEKRGKDFRGHFSARENFFPLREGYRQGLFPSSRRSIRHKKTGRPQVTLTL